MIKSMTGYSRVQTKEKGVSATVELKSLNGRYLDINCKIPRSLSHREFDIRDMIGNKLERGSVFISATIDYEEGAFPLKLNYAAAKRCFEDLKNLKSKLKLREAVKIDHLLEFSGDFYERKDDEASEIEWRPVKSALNKALTSLDNMRKNEGRRIAKDLTARVRKIKNKVEEVDALGVNKIPEEREKLRMKIAQLFETEEIDEQRLQMEIALLADKLDISEECVRMLSHVKFFNEMLKSRKQEPVGKKMNFLLQEMHREVNTIGSKCNDAEIQKQVVYMKEEVERIREQIQNIE